MITYNATTSICGKGKQWQRALDWLESSPPRTPSRRDSVQRHQQRLRQGKQWQKCYRPGGSCLGGAGHAVVGAGHAVARTPQGTPTRLSLGSAGSAYGG